MGEGRHVRFTVDVGRRALACGRLRRRRRDGAGAARRRQARHDLTARLEANEWRGAVEPRLVLRSLHPLARRRRSRRRLRRALPRRAGWWDARLGAPTRPRSRGRPVCAERRRTRTVVDRRGEGAVGRARRPDDDRRAAARRVRGRVAPRSVARARPRAGALRARAVGALVGGLRPGCRRARHARAAAPVLCRVRAHSSADPGLLSRSRTCSRSTRRRWPRPRDRCAAAPAREARSCTSAWGRPRSSSRAGYGSTSTRLRPHLEAVYRALAALGQGSAEVLARAARGRGHVIRAAPWSAGRCLRVLDELGLAISTAQALPLDARSRTAERADLERSQTFRASARAAEEGHRFLETLTPETPKATRRRGPRSGHDRRWGRQRRAVAFGRADPGRGRRSRRRCRPTRTSASACASRRAAAAAAVSADAIGAGLLPHEQELLADLFAVIAEHSDDAVRPGRPRARSGRRSPSPASATRTSAASRARSSSRTRSAWRRSARACASTRRRSAPALLHDTVEDTSASLDDVRERFGDDIAQLVDGVTKLTGITFQSRDEQQAENYRKMMVAMATRHQGDPDQAGRPPPQHAHARRAAEAEADREGEGDARHLRAARAPARHPLDQVGAGGPRVLVAAPAQVQRDQVARQPAARGARGLRRARRPLPDAGARAPSASRRRSPGAPSTSTRSTRR